MFYAPNCVRKCITVLKADVSCYKQLEIEISKVIPAKMLETFMWEMNMFLSFFDSCENYYYLQQSKLISCPLAGKTHDTPVIEKGKISLRTFAAVLASKIYEFEFRHVDVHGGDLRAVHEASHVCHLVDCLTIRDSAELEDDLMTMLMGFVSLRLGRTVDPATVRKELQYNDHFGINFYRDYRFVYLNCWQEMTEKLASEARHSRIAATARSSAGSSAAQKRPHLVLIDLTED